MTEFRSTSSVMMGVLSAALLFGSAAHAQEATPGEPVIIVAADPAEQPDAAIARAPQYLRQHRAKPASPATDAAKAAVTAEAARAAQSSLRPGDESAASPSPALAVLPGLNFSGIAGGTPNTNGTPPDNEGAIGPNSYIQTVNAAVRIFNRTTHTIIANGPLNRLGANASTVDSFDPQIIWDPTTNRFYYAMDSVYSGTDNRIAFGFSKSASPTDLTTAWCHYSVMYGTPFPDYPKLGDSRDFILVGVNVFANNTTGGFTGSDLVAVAKPTGTGAISTCPSATSLKASKATNLKDSNALPVFTPVPANQIDNNPTGYAVAQGWNSPFTKLWFFNVTKSADGWPIFGKARGVTVPTHDFPPNVPQSNGRYLDTLDARNTQAIQAVDPAHGGVQAFWTQHTVKLNGKYGPVSAVRWYEINPKPATPVILRTGLIASSSAFFFNAAISPDRARQGTTAKFGDSFVIQYNAASQTLSPGIMARASRNGGAISKPTWVRKGVAPYVDFSCYSSGNTCRWGDYAAATPDPVPGTTGSGVVWSTNQFSGLLSPPPGGVNWRTRIFAIQP